MGRLSKSAARKVFSITFRLMFIETLYTIAYFDIFRLHFYRKVPVCMGFRYFSAKFLSK